MRKICLLIIALVASAAVRAEDVVTQPFSGVRYIHRTIREPRLLDMNIVEIDLTNPQLRFQTTESSGGAVGETRLETTSAFVTRIGAQIGINANFFANDKVAQNSGVTRLISLAAANGNLVSPWGEGATAVYNNAVNLSKDNVATILSRAANDLTGSQTDPPVSLHNAVAGSARILRNGAVSVANDGVLNPASAVGVTAKHKLLLLVADGRQPQRSLGLTYLEVAQVLLEFGATDAICLDGGGSSTMVFADGPNGSARVVNSPSDGQERKVGNNLALFAAPSLATDTKVEIPVAKILPGDHEQSLTWEKRERSYLLHVPPYDGKTSLPLVLVLHGGGGNASGTVKMTGFSAKADKEGFFVVYPNGTGRLKDRLLTWDADNCCGYALDNKVDDVGFIRAMIEALEKELKIDSKKIFATGMSNGGMMTYRLGRELSDKLAAIAPVAGALNSETPPPKSPVSVIVFHGTADQHVPYEGGQGKQKADFHERTDQSVAAAVSFWVKHNQCEPQPKKIQKGNVEIETYRGGQEGTEVILYTLNGEDHTWPGGQKYPGGREPTREISATAAMWEFFTKHPKR